MVNKVFLATLVADMFFLASGALELAFSLVVRSQMNATPSDGEEATRNLLYQRFPLTAGIVNGGLILFTFVLTLPGLLSPGRSWLKKSGYVVTLCGIFSLCLGVYLWVMTLRLKDDFFDIYLGEEPEVHDLIQTTV